MKKSILSFMIIVLYVIILTGCNKKSMTETEPETVTDIDGNVYQTIKIGDQVWLAENLKVTHYRDGSPISHVTDRYEWLDLETGAYCAYDNNESYAETYGYLYNWYAITGSHNIAPKGWHVPTDNDWKELEMYLGMEQGRADNTGWRGAGKEGGKLKEAGTTHWKDPNMLGTNESGFCALPGGYRHQYGYFESLTEYAYFWTATLYIEPEAWFRKLYYNGPVIYRDGYNFRGGFSVRLIKD